MAIETPSASPGPGLSRTSRAAMWAAAAGLLLLPLIAMQITTEVNWTLGDFLVFAGMLLVLCGALELIARSLKAKTTRIIAAALSLVLFLAVWAGLATG